MGITFLMPGEQVFCLATLCSLHNVIEGSCITGPGDELAVSSTDRFGLWYSWSCPEGGESTIYTALQAQFVSFSDAVVGESQKQFEDFSQYPNVSCHTSSKELWFSFSVTRTIKDKRPDFALH